MKNWPSTSLTCALVAATLTLIGCCSTKPIWPEYEIGSQPDYLYLPKGTTIQTAEGVYRAQANEKWVNPRVVQRYQDALRGVVGAKEEAELKELLK